MDLTINNDISKNNTNDKEISSFMQELQNSLNNTECKTPSINNEILNEISLASTYKNELTNIVNKCMENLSYEYDFLYFDYDEGKQKYFFDYYFDGDIEREYLTKNDVQELNIEKGSFWRQYENNSIVEAEDFADNIKINVESELDLLDWNLKKGK